MVEELGFEEDRTNTSSNRRERKRVDECLNTSRDTEQILVFFFSFSWYKNILVFFLLFFVRMPQIISLLRVASASVDRNRSGG